MWISCLSRGERLGQGHLWSSSSGSAVGEMAWFARAKTARAGPIRLPRSAWSLRAGLTRVPVPTWAWYGTVRARPTWARVRVKSCASTENIR